MSHLEIILPFCIPPAALAPDLLRELHTPAFARLIALSRKGPLQSLEAFARRLPHESLLAGHIHVASRTGIVSFESESESESAAGSAAGAQQHRLSELATTHHKMAALGLTPAAGFWFTLSPVHIHIARDHLVLTDQRKLDLSEAEALALFAAAAPMCEELGKTLLYGDAKTWFLRADDWQELQTATMDAACGHNIDIWMPTGAQELPWRKLQNELQMLWFIHDVNAQREARGANLVNSVWLHGGSAALLPAAIIYDSRHTIDQMMATMKQPGKTRLLLDALLEPALNNDWASWLDAMHQLEAGWFSPLLQALKDKQLRQLSFITSDANSLMQFSLSPRSLWKFWTRPSLDQLFAAPALTTPTTRTL